jgi:hypothetical protein
MPINLLAGNELEAKVGKRLKSPKLSRRNWVLRITAPENKQGE